ncbi:MAG: extracellular solute-binding protein [Oscillospiraceae bacterium]|jgi:hypothetical protein|nr:extracellular solute-binding protein [Oscillospiraceae bacterium]
MKLKHILALILAVSFMLIMLAACEEATEEEYDGPPTFAPPDYDLPEKGNDVIRLLPDGRRHIIIGTFYDTYYDSTHTSIYDNPSISDPETAQMALDRVRYVEEKYNVFIEFVNMTWDGIIENIPISIMSGIPDADVYWVEPQFGLSPVLNNMAQSLESMGLDSTHDVFAPAGQNIVMETLLIPGMENHYFFAPSAFNVDMYMLGYNRELIQLHSLEDPQTLWYRGEWTWDKFREYCRVLTNPAQNIYGYSGFWTNFLEGMLFSNDASFAPGPIQHLTSPETLEVLDFINVLYNVDKSARPWNPDDWDINNNLFREGLSGFWIAVPWINQQWSDLLAGQPAPFDVGMVPYPVGPRSTADTMKTFNALTNKYYFIPRYIQDARQVFDVMYDLTNWFDGDLEYRDDLLWFENHMISQANIDIYIDVVGRNGFELMMSLGFGPSLDSMIENTTGPAVMTPAQYAETYSLVFQDALDNYFE